MIRFNRISDNLTISKIFQYTFKYHHTRFDNADRDILPSKFRLVERKLYRKNKEGKYSAPDELIICSSWSAPQYKPYTDIKGKNSKRQMSIKHNYEIMLAIQKNNNGIYSYQDSKIIWRVGSKKRWEFNPPQKKVKTIYSETRKRLERKYRKLSEKDRKIKIDKEIEKIKKSAKYLDVGDYNSRVLKLNGDFYFRQQWIMEKFGCLYGPCHYKQPNKNVIIPFFGKHELATLSVLIRKGIIKV